MKNILEMRTHPDDKAKRIKKKREELIRGSKDKARNIKRASEGVEANCIVCGGKIKKGQPIRSLPKDRKCQEVRVYHLRSCGPGSEKWKAFKANSQGSPREPLHWHQLTFNWKKGTPRRPR